MLSPRCIKEERDRQPQWLDNYSYYTINIKTLTMAAFYDMQYGKTSDNLILNTDLSNPAIGLVYLLKALISDGLYHIALHPEDAPNMGLVFPS